MISVKTNTGKLPVPERKHKDSIRTFEAHPATRADAPPGALNAAAVAAGNVIGEVPDFMDRKKHPELNVPKPANDARKGGTVAALAAQIQDPEKRAAVEKVEAEKTAKRSTKRAVKAEKRRAAADGATRAMPLTGKAAAKTIRKAVKASAPKAARSPARSKVAAKKTAAAKPDKVTVGQTAREAILGGKTNEQALAAVMRKHPDCKSNVGCMRWYRNQLRKDGKLKEPKARPTSAA